LEGNQEESKARISAVHVRIKRTISHAISMT
jgi:hypothetical protein